MSASAVRSAARAVCQDASWPVPFVESVGENPEPGTVPDEWSTVQFDPYDDEPIGVGPASPWRETGQIVFVIGTKSGQGDSAAVGYAATAVGVIRGWDWGSSGIYVISISPPKTDDPGGEGRFLRMHVEVEYEYDHA